MSEGRLLIVEDEENLARGIQENLEAEGFETEVEGRGQKALERILGETWDLVLLDVMLPDLDGLTVCESVRNAGNDVPVLFLTARGGVDDRIRGLEAGGDDYLAKPFHLDELLLRIKAILRRRLQIEEVRSKGSVLRFGGNWFDFASFEGQSFDGKKQTLTKKEAMILKLLSERVGEVVSRDEILDRVWGYDLFPSSRTVDNFIVRLRKRFEPEEDPRFFHTVRGVGYRFTPG
jgi:two-component system alkaline phosphatase synthesis response regulator PhoP